ncbi:hypothetical protein BDF14DRAFT_1837770 [Spinellus fusiger]|nr:hypothetical protein BDF14DRAFT_1837770 [Spinellus fusiger]
MTSDPAIHSPQSQGTNNSADTRIHPLSPSLSHPGNEQSSPLLQHISDDVTTIFVVGFPEDMQEREFQNMFTFSRGFEAASLKWYCKEGEEEGPSASLLSVAGKKQMIGFARFHTRFEALEAVEVLTGKRVDIEKGQTLKAEMAKKNLHVNRVSVSANNTLLADNPWKKDYDIFLPLPSDLLSPSADYKNDPFLADLGTRPSTPVFSDTFFGLRSQSFDVRSPSAFGMPARAFSLYPPARKSLPCIEDETFNYLSKSTPLLQDHNNLNHGVSYFGDNDYLSTRLGSFSLASSGDYGNHRPPLNTLVVTGNPADQNPPCNTLYVGNLPPSTSEEELRQLFNQCSGYKRMCFRNKPQGPMCFVEFEDVVYATQALSELQGKSLSNSVKGGIRLSFSKNPLFTKPNKDSLPFYHKQLRMPVLDRKELFFDPQL